MAKEVRDGLLNWLLLYSARAAAAAVIKSARPYCVRELLLWIYKIKVRRVDTPHTEMLIRLTSIWQIIECEGRLKRGFIAASAVVHSGVRNCVIWVHLGVWMSFFFIFPCSCVKKASKADWRLSTCACCIVFDDHSLPPESCCSSSRRDDDDGW